MATRRDQVQSYQFLMQRVVSALVIHDTDPQQPPLRRFVGSAFAGVMIAIIAIAGVAVFGMLVQGGKKTWRSPQAIVLEKETGARYVFRDGVLHPMANYASARLLGASVPVSASRKSLAGTPRGETLGIPGAPDLVPRAADLLRGAWTLCAQPGDGTSATRTILLVGQSPSGQKPLGTDAVLVTAADDPARVVHLVWQNRRYEIRDADVVLKALAWQAIAPVPVRLAWLNALPTGPPIARIPVPAGTSRFRNVPAGRLFFVRNAAGDTQTYVAVPNGLARVTSMQADLLRGDPAVNPDGRAPEEIQASQVVESNEPVANAGGQVPGVTPKINTTRSARAPLCAVFPPGGGDPTMLAEAQVPAGSPAGDVRGSGPGGAPLVDRVVVPSGKGVLVNAVPSPGSTVGTTLLVTEPGRAFPVAADVASSQLGFGGAAPVRLPTALVNRLPLGPALDPVAAGLPVR